MVPDMRTLAWPRAAMGAVPAKGGEQRYGEYRIRLPATCRTVQVTISMISNFLGPRGALTRTTSPTRALSRASPMGLVAVTSM